MLWLLKILSRLPLSVLYALGDFAFVVTFYLVRWRRDIASGNLARSFPEKSEAERARILRRNYRNMGRLLAEALWGVNASREALRARVVIENPELIQAYADRGQSILLMAAHFCNWEWLILAAGLYMPMPVAAVYKPQRNEGADQFLKKARTRFGGSLIPHKTFAVEALKRRNEMYAYALVADQTPLKSDPKHWEYFLNQDTAFFVGTDKLAKLLKAPVLYIAMRRVKRGHYAIRFELLAEPPYESGAGDALTSAYAKVLEREIKANPEDWLWVHKKWKYAKPLYTDNV